MKSLLLVVSGLGILATGCGYSPGSRIDTSNLQEAWNANNDPRNLHDQYVVAWDSLPKTGETTAKPWTDTYWPSYQGGIAQRWNDPARVSAFEYALVSQTTLASMTLAQRATLSPAEKYDALLGNFDYPLVTYERERTNPTDPSWFGLCHGWAPAAINFKEPSPVVLTGAGGIEIPFGSSDVKALLIFAQQYGSDSRTVGDRCNHDLSTNPDRANDPACRDTNAGSFHIVLTNEIGLLDRGFVAEVNRSYQIWNQPVYGFKSEAISDTTQVYAGAAPGTVRIIRVKTVMNYLSELGPTWEPLPMAEFPQQQAAQALEYTLELDDGGAIIGGEWLSGERPDFLWTQQPPALTGFFAELARLYEASIQ